MEKKAFDIEKLKELGLDQLENVTGGYGYFEGPLGTAEKMECKDILKSCRKTYKDLNLDQAILSCSYLLRRKTYDDEVASYVKEIFDK